MLRVFDSQPVRWTPDRQLWDLSAQNATGIKGNVTLLGDTTRELEHTGTIALDDLLVSSLPGRFLLVIAPLSNDNQLLPELRLPVHVEACMPGEGRSSGADQSQVSAGWWHSC